MQEIIKFIIGIIILIIGIPIGNYLAKYTKEELKQGQKWFILIVILSVIGAVYSLIVKQDYFLFTFLFIALVTSRSLK